VLFLYGADVVNVPEVQLVNDVTHIEGLDMLIDHQPSKDVLICVGADMEVTGYLLDREGSCQPASIVLLEGLFSHLKLFRLVGLSQEFKIPTIEPLSQGVQPILLNRGYA